MANGDFFIGRVTLYVRPSNTYHVESEQGGKIVGVVSLIDYACGILGMKSAPIIEPGTQVLLLSVSNSVYIIATVGIPTQNKGLLFSNHNGTNTIEVPSDFGESEDKISKAAKDKVNRNTGMFPQTSIPGDKIDLNAYGVGTVISGMLASLTASQLANVEVCLLDELVRITSQTYQNFNIQGETEISGQNGLIDEVEKSVAYEHESKAMSYTEGEGPSSESAKNNLEKWMDSRRFMKAAHYRFLRFKGATGNFVTEFLADPIEALFRDDNGDISVKGRSFFHKGMEGGFIYSTAGGDITFEIVPKVAVPTYNTRAELLPPDNQLDYTFYQEWDKSRDSNKDEYVYKLFDYARWYTRTYCYASFLSNKALYKVPTGEQIGTPDNTNGLWFKQETQEPEGSDFPFNRCISRFTMFRNGAIVLLDGFGSSITMNEGNITISSRMDLKLEAGRHLILDSAQDMALNANLDIGMEAQNGMITQKCNTAMSMEACSISMRADKNLTSDNSPMSVKKDLKVEVGDDQKGNIYIASNNDIGIHAQRQLFTESVTRTERATKENVVMATNTTYMAGNTPVANISAGGIKLKGQVNATRVVADSLAQAAGTDKVQGGATVDKNIKKPEEPEGQQKMKEGLKSLTRTSALKELYISVVNAVQMVRETVEVMSTYVRSFTRSFTDQDNQMNPEEWFPKFCKLDLIKKSFNVFKWYTAKCNPDKIDEYYQGNPKNTDQNQVKRG